jgi:Mce-associated membrane protein
MRIPRARLVVPIVLVAAVVGTGIPATLLYNETLVTAAADANKATASAAAKTRVERILSYRFGTVQQDLTEAKAATTGEFAQQFATAADKVIAPAAQETQITTSAVVVSTAVISSAPDSVVTLVFANQTTTTKDKPQASTSALRLRVTLDQVNGQWLISHLAQV